MTKSPAAAFRFGSARILADCRWLGVSGLGRVTELLLRGLRELAPSGQWLLWGPESVRTYRWDGARHAACSISPRALWGQAALHHVPSHDIALFMNQIRPLHRGPSVTLVHDTIPLRHGPRLRRPLLRLYYRLVGHLSSRIVTASEFARDRIMRDLGVTADRIGMLHYPVDPVLVHHVRAIRERTERRQTVLYVGRFAPHKNLPRLIQAFARTRFAASGGELLLVGGTPDATLSRLAASAGHVTVSAAVEQSMLEELYATCRLLVMPSLEEGFGLPVWEAITCGLPVCVSDGGALPEVAGSAAVPFPAASEEAMAAAIDASIARGCTGPVPGGPSLRDFAAQVLAELERAA